MKKYWFWFFLAIASVCIVVLLWLNSQATTKTPETTTLPSVVVTQKPAWPTLAIVETTPSTGIPLNIKNQLIAKLPYETDTFLVEYLKKAGKLYVTIKAPSHLANYEQAISWLKEQQIPNPQNNLEVRFVYLEKE